MFSCPGHHIYHKECIKGWFRQGKTSCCECRENLKEKSFENLYGDGEKIYNLIDYPSYLID